MSRNAIKACQTLEDKIDLVYNLAMQMEDANAGRELDALRVEAYEHAEAVDELLRPEDSFELILEDFYIAFLAGWCKSELEARIPTSADGARRRANEYIADLKELERRERGGRDRNSRRDRDDRGSRRERDRDERNSRRNTRERTRERDEETSRERNRGFGKGRRERSEALEETEVVVKEFKGKPSVFDPRKFKLIKGVLVETFEEHELSTVKPSYDKPKVESRRIEYISRPAHEVRKELPIFDNFEDFVCCTPDDSLEVGVIQKRRKFLSNPEIEDAFTLNRGGEPLQQMMQMVADLRNSDNPSTIRFCEVIKYRLVAALEITANLYSRVKMDYVTNDALTEWEETQTMFSNPDVFDPGIESQFRAVYNGMVRSLLTIDKSDKDGCIEIATMSLAVKSTGAFCRSVEAAGDAKLLRINDEYHPELDTVATAALEIRDTVFGDAWSDHGIMPIILADTAAGNAAMIISEKASSAKFYVNKRYSF